MINLKERSTDTEILDQDDIPFAHIRQNMQELNTINTWLGGHSITIEGIIKIIKSIEPGRNITVCEIGCGGGDNLKAIDNWCTRNKVIAHYTGIDIKTACIEFAREQYPMLNARWIISDYKEVSFEGYKPDIIFSSLFCHHFQNQSIVPMLHWMRSNAASGFFINDLHRHVLAYYSIKTITAVFSSSYLVKNDAPLSVARGFKKKDWQEIFKDAGITAYLIQWKWAFRHLIVCKC